MLGYIGKQDAFPILIKGLHRLEYQGYDSAGVALINQSDDIVKNIADYTIEIPETVNSQNVKNIKVFRFTAIDSYLCESYEKEICKYTRSFHGCSGVLRRSRHKCHNVLLH